ncbi:MAG: hypothetical protein JNN07_03765 [Verrucomicrobiales bacterium]|nr:hypothetical protein [Verrucomicrobiales bacterium]
MNSPRVALLLCLMVHTVWNSCLAAPAESRSGSLAFGWATETITPPKPVAIGGQYHTRISGDSHDPLTVTALALETRDAEGVIDQVLWISCDLVGIRKRSVDQVRQRIAKSIPDLDVRKLVISATHTHTAPAITDANETNLHPYDFAGSWAYRIPADRKDIMHPLAYLDYLEQQIATAAIRAWKSRQPGGFSSGLGHVSVARNRRAVYFDGTTRLYGDTKDPGFSHTEGASDDSLDGLFFWRGGKMIGMVLTLYCPSQSVEGELYLSADFWYDARKALRERFSPDLFVLPLNGASGDQSPHIQVGKNAELGMLKRRQLEYRQEIGRRIVQSVTDVAELAKASVRSEVRLAHRVEQVRLPVWKVSDQRFAEASKLVQAGKDRQNDLTSPDYINWRVSRTMVARYELQKTDPYYPAEIHVLRLDDLALATNPFELYSDYSTRIKARSPATQTSVVQLTADCPAYLPTERAVQGGGYSARIDDGVVGPEGGRVLVEETTRLLKSLW